MKKITRVEYQKQIRKKKTRLKPWFFWFLIFIFTSLITLSIIKIIFWHQDNKKINKLENDIEQLTNYEIIEEEGTLINPPKEEKKDEKPSDYWYYVSFPFYKVDFTNLINKNKDTVAFIHLNNTNINYPVVQTKDNDYYLTHAFDKSYNKAGWVYMDYRNNPDNLSDNTIIYGHGRLDNTVFGSLKKTLTEKWQSNKDNYVINISTPKQNYLYQIFSIYTIKSESYYIKTNFANTKEKENWVKTMVERNTATSITTKANVNDKFLTLSTCYNNNDIRIVVQAKLIKSTKNQ